MRGCQVPAFKNWDYEGDLYGAPPPPPPPRFLPTCSNNAHPRRRRNVKHMVKKRDGDSGREQQRKHGRVCDVVLSSNSPAASPSPKIAMAIDEDLYSIPPELLYKKPNKKKPTKKIISGYLTIACLSC